jgi:hypothetical protein
MKQKKITCAPRALTILSQTPKLTAAQRAPIQGYVEKLYTFLSSDSWMYLLQQIIKVSTSHDE